MAKIFRVRRLAYEPKRRGSSQAITEPACRPSTPRGTIALTRARLAFPPSEEIFKQIRGEEPGSLSRPTTPQGKR